jgi:ABC-type branched-subunit amino acid transport system substrate-binding protein
MRGGILHLLAGTAVAIALSATSASAQKKYDTGASDTEIKIGQTVPFSGPASAYAGIGKTQAAYFKMINEQGGINGRKLNLIQYDDAYSPPKAVEQVRKLVEATRFCSPSRSSARRRTRLCRNISTARRCRNCSPRPAHRNSPTRRIFRGRWASTQLPVRGAHLRQYILKNHPNAKIGILYQNDDLGRDYITGLKEALGGKAATMIVAEASMN